MKSFEPVTGKDSVWVTKKGWCYAVYIPILVTELFHET